MIPVIAQSDLVTAYGWGIDALWHGLLSRQTAIKTSDRFSQRGFVSNQSAEIPDLEISPGKTRARAMLDRLLVPLIGKLDPQTTIILATTVCEIEFIEQAILDNNPVLSEQAHPQQLLQHVKSLLGLQGLAMVLSSACASSSAALAQAAGLVQRGESGCVLVIACDAISEFVYSGFSTLLSLSDTPARPFDAHRCGLSLGEAAAWALITPDDSPLAKPNSVAIRGWSSTTDAIHMTAPDREADGLSRAIHAACAMADVTPAEISFIAAHGTATLYNDAMELLAFKNTVENPVPVFSIKGGIGHTLGAAGLTQILVTEKAMLSGVVPPTVGFFTADVNAAGWVSDEAIKVGSNLVALSTNSGFGGVNTAVLLGSTRLSHPRDIVPAPSICAIGWYSPSQCGWLAGDKTAALKQPPSLSSAREMSSLINRPIKYFSRMTIEARCSLAAASLALTASGCEEGPTGIISSGFAGCLAADQIYFKDYVAGGLSLGRANLFIYTLPTSAISEVAIALSLTGPTLHLHDQANSINFLIGHAKRLIEDRQAHSMLVVFADGQSAVCIAIGTGKPLECSDKFPWEASASQMCVSLAAMAALK